MILYHLDKARSLQTNTEIQFVPPEKIPTDLKQTDFFSFFEHGISQHGLTYLKLSCSTYPFIQNWNGEIFYTQDSVSYQISTVSMSILEFGVELVRRAYFSQYPSRLQSLFAVRNIDDFRQWPELCRPEEIPHENIIALDVSDDTNCFDSRWLRGGLIHGTTGDQYYIGYSSALCFDLAYKYWSKTPSNDPRWEYLIPLPIDGFRVRAINPTSPSDQGLHP